MDDRTKLMRVPMKYIDGEWVIEFGGELPIVHGAEGELLIEQRLVQDSPQKRLFTDETYVPILPAGTHLWAIVDVKDRTGLSQEQENELTRRASVYQPYSTDAPVAQNGAFLVPVTLGKPTDWQANRYGDDNTGLWLRTQGVTAIGLISSPVILPACVSSQPAASLNHAFTILSEMYERWRRSHTGSVYRQFLYEEQDGKWYPLSLLRRSHLATETQRIAAELWKGIIAPLRGVHSS